MTADLKPGDSRTVKLTGAMVAQEFMAQCVAPLQSRPRPLWKLGDEGDDLHLGPEPLFDEEFARLFVPWSGMTKGSRLMALFPCTATRMGRRLSPLCLSSTIVGWCRLRPRTSR